MKVSVIMPTYNDADSIEVSVKSVLNQDYKNIELIIVNDGSSDETEQIIKSLNDERIIYIFQENSDQLNAVINGFNNSTGDIIYILHSDDLFYDDKSISNAVNEMLLSECDALKGDIITIDEDDNVTGIVKVRDFSNKQVTLTRMLLLYGINILNDIAFIKRDAFEKYSYNNYLLWNTPFWVNFNDKSYDCLNFHISIYPIARYRVHEQNYINNKLGKYNVVNGNLRTLMYLMDVYTVPFFLINRFLSRLRKDKYTPKYKLIPTKNKHKIIKRAIKHRVGSVYRENIYLTSVINFYKKLRKLKNKEKAIELENEINTDDIYYGKDMRKFNETLISGNLSPLYYEIFDRMNEGFNAIRVKQNERDDIENILKFLNIFLDVKIILK
ncbi:glycosyltransferase [Paenibacillus sp. NRS-1760]|uniref:glycosyltransferase n=1 Tax=Paenibacillus sp. NRS-1760 TaxID=3233902 RepID=UPI003D2C8D17